MDIIVTHHLNILKIMKALQTIIKKLYIKIYIFNIDFLNKANKL